MRDLPGNSLQPGSLHGSTQKRSLAAIQTTATFRPVTQSAKILQCVCRCDALRD